MESNFFRDRRKELSLTQRQISLTLDITESTVQNWEAFRTPPPLSMVIELARVYRVSVERIEQAIVTSARVIQKREQKKSLPETPSRRAEKASA